jgi:GNAT superfamily N-acetyltransferase
MPELIVKSPAECTNLEIGAFIAFVRAGGEVSTQGLPERIRGAAALAFARVDGLVVGVAALKQPQASYRRRVSTESGAALSAQEFPFELGWVYVSPELRGNGFSFLLSQAALAESNAAGVFATSRTDNIAMHRSLAKLGFEVTGNPFLSGRGKHSLQVFSRHAAQPGIQEGLAQKRASPLI